MMEDECIQVSERSYWSFFSVEGRVFEMYFELTEANLPEFESVRCSDSLFNMLQENLGTWKQVLDKAMTPQAFVRDMKRLVSVAAPPPFLTEEAFQQVLASFKSPSFLLRTVFIWYIARTNE